VNEKLLAGSILANIDYIRSLESLLVVSVIKTMVAHPDPVAGYESAQVKSPFVITVKVLNAI
jgi:hypothetical protein